MKRRGRRERTTEWPAGKMTISGIAKANAFSSFLSGYARMA